LPLLFLPDVKRGLDHCGIAWIELEYVEADDVIATLAGATPEPPPTSRHPDFPRLPPTTASYCGSIPVS
ncbi:MAG: hypothetical protein ACRDS0_35270, partial [Pseudonocardiaceae bacterium]